MVAPICSIGVAGQGGITTRLLHHIQRVLDVLRQRGLLQAVLARHVACWILQVHGVKYPGSGSDRYCVIYGALLRTDVMPLSLPDDSWYASVLWPFLCLWA